MNKTKPQAKKNKRSSHRAVIVKSITGRLLRPPGSGEVFRANLVNVGAAGAQICTNQTLENHLRVSLELDSLDGARLLTYAGQVVWIRKNPLKSMGRFAVGIQFDGLTSAQSRFLGENYALGFTSPKD